MEAVTTGRVGRRHFLQAISASLLAAPSAVGGQPTARIYRLGILGNIPPSDSQGARVWGAFAEGLRDLGYIEGQNLIVDHRSSEGRTERLPGLAAELVRLKPDVIVAANQVSTLAAREATETFPIVGVNFDPLGSGLVASFARPGGNVTGLSLLAPELVGKQLQLLKEILPRLRRVAVLWNPVNRASLPLLAEAKGAARALGLQLQSVQVRHPDEIESVFTRMSRERTEAVLVLGDGMLILQRARIADLAARTQLPAMYVMREHMAAGGLVFYGPSMGDNFRRAATYVDKILKGANPAVLPIEQPTKFELVINLKTAKALGLTIPPFVLARADQVIE